MVVAKSQEALVNLQKQIKEKIASREYIAVIHGAPNSEEGQIVGHIGSCLLYTSPSPRD